MMFLPRFFRFFPRGFFQTFPILSFFTTSSLDRSQHQRLFSHFYKSWPVGQRQSQLLLFLSKGEHLALLSHLLPIPHSHDLALSLHGCFVPLHTLPSFNLSTTFSFCAFPPFSTSTHFHHHLHLLHWTPPVSLWHAPIAS